MLHAKVGKGLMLLGTQLHIACQRTSGLEKVAMRINKWQLFTHQYKLNGAMNVLVEGAEASLLLICFFLDCV